MSKTIKNFIFFLIVFLIGGGLLVFFIIWPTTQNIAETKKAISKSENELLQAQTKYDNLRKISKSENTASMLTKITDLWPENKEISNFVISMENLAKSENLTFNNLSLSDIATKKTKGSKDTSSKVQFSFTTEGQYTQIMSVIKKLEKFERYNTITNLAFTKKGDGNINATITGVIYYGK